MPADDLFPEGTKPNPDTPVVAPKPNGGDPTPGEGVTLEQAAELIKQGIAPLGDQIKSLAETTATVVSQLQSQGAPPGDPTPAPPTEDFLTRFAENPEGAIQGLVAGQMQSAVPLMSGLINSTVSNFVGRETLDINREFGSGAWEKFFDKPLSILMDGYRRSNVVALADDSTIRREVDGLKGKMFDELVEYRETSRKTASEKTNTDTKGLVDATTKEVLQQTNLTGGIRRIDSGTEEVTESVKGYLAERIAALGGSETGKEFLERTDYGSSIEDYLAHQKKTEKAAATGGA